MPTYVYEYLEGPRKGLQFELIQSMREPPRVKDPETGEAIARVLTAPMILGADTGYAARAALKDNNKLTQMGFTKYQRSSDGTYERTAGTEGPRHVDPRGGSDPF